MQQRVVMISGANRGIGLCIAKQLFNNTDYSLSLGMRTPNQFSSNDFLLNEERVLLNVYDATNIETAKAWVDSTKKTFGGIDILINNAGVFLPCSIEQYEESALDQLWAINTKAPVELTQLAWEYLKQSGTGRIVNIVSISGKTTHADDFGYTLTKHAMLAFTHSIRQTGWKYGIRSVAICPGWVNTDMARRANVCSLQPEEMTQPEDIAQLIQTLIQLPNTASIAELTINAECGMLF